MATTAAKDAAKTKTVEHIRVAIVDAYILLDAVVVGFANVVDRAKLGRKIMLYFTLYLTYSAYNWATTFAFAHADKSGIEIGAVVAAILLPIGLLQKAVFDSYLSSTQAETNDAPAAPSVDKP